MGQISSGDCETPFLILRFETEESLQEIYKRTKFDYRY